MLEEKNVCSLIQNKTPVYLVNDCTGLLESYVVLNYDKDGYGRVYVNLEGINETYGFCCEYLDLLFTDMRECINAINVKKSKLVSEYKNFIKTVEDLVRFMYSKDFRGDTIDCDARKVVITEKAKEFGIVL